jgi:phage shock protein PspC (stress-responsive transcriptional regulator)
MQSSQPNLFTRPDTFFGVCEGLGEDLRIHPNLLRAALTVLIFFNPAAAVTVYAGAGALVLVTRLLFPVPGPTASDAVATEASVAAEESPVGGDVDAEAEVMSLAA